MPRLPTHGRFADAPKTTPATVYDESTRWARTTITYRKMKKHLRSCGQ
jgi:hypothetical protein